jgi:hypothetical protein
MVAYAAGLKQSPIFKWQGTMRTIEPFTTASPLRDQTPEVIATREFQTTLVGMMGHDLRQVPCRAFKGRTSTALVYRRCAATSPAWIVERAR